MSDKDIKDRLREKIDEVSQSDTPWIYRWPAISHYYGDTVRQLLLASAAIMLIGAPYYTDDIGTEIFFILIGALVLVVVSAMTSPWKQSVISLDAVVAGVGLVIFELWALMGYGDVAIKFILREFLAILFLFAFYFSTKTLRAMLLHQIGKRDSRLDFLQKSNDDDITDIDALELSEEKREWMHEHNEEEKQKYH